MTESRATGAVPIPTGPDFAGGYESEVLTDSPAAFVGLADLPPTYVERQYSPDHLFTVERRGVPYLVVILSAAGVVHDAYVNGEPVGAEHPLVVELVADWEPPKRWLPEGWFDPKGGSTALYERALTDAEREAHVLAAQVQP